MSVIDEIAAERRRQTEAEGWSAEHDDGHHYGQMAMAAASYIIREDHRTEYTLVPTITGYVSAPKIWPWTGNWWKPKSRRRDLIRAAALLVAEIERLDRKAERELPNRDGVRETP